MKNYNRDYTARNLGHYSSGAMREIAFIVLHDTAGSGTVHDVEYLASDPEHRGISVDFCIPKDGTVYQLNPDVKKNWTFHAGRHTKFRDYLNGQVNVHSIGIEIAQKADMSKLGVPLYPDIQIAAVGNLCRDLCISFSLSKTNITTHSKIITDGTRSDPRQFPWNQFWFAFSNTSLPPLTDPIYHKVQAGDTLYSLSIEYLTSVEKLKALNNMNTASNQIQVGQSLLVKE